MKVVDVDEEMKSLDIEYFEIKDLPSNFKLYPKETKIFGRRLKVPEVKKLSELNSDNFDLVINSVLSNSIKGINIIDLKIPDKLYIIFWLRANTYKEPGYVIDFRCNKCDKDTSYSFSLDNLSIIYLDKKFNSKFIFDNNNIEIDFVSVKDQQDMIEVKENFKDIDKEDLELASNIGKINNKELSLIEKYNYLRELEPSIYIKLKTFIKDNDFGFKEYLDVKCNECGGMAQVGVSFCRSFFIPEYKT